MKRRAEQQEETRRRIVQATVDLHARVGPLATTITAIAEQAGVQRLTVYRHFPDESTLLAACRSHFFATIPPPDLDELAPVVDPAQRLQRGLTELYAYWSRHEQMFAGILRDYELEPERVGSGTVEYMRAVRDVLAGAWDVDGELCRILVGAVGHAVHFRTWRSLVREQQLAQQQAVELMVCFVQAVAAGQGQISKDEMAGP